MLIARITVHSLPHPDEHSKVASHRMGSTAAAATPDFADLPITLVNQYMYED